MAQTLLRRSCGARRGVHLHRGKRSGYFFRYCAREIDGGAALSGKSPRRLPQSIDEQSQYMVCRLDADARVGAQGVPGGGGGDCRRAALGGDSKGGAHYAGERSCGGVERAHRYAAKTRGVSQSMRFCRTALYERPRDGSARCAPRRASLDGRRGAFGGRRALCREHADGGSLHAPAARRRERDGGGVKAAPF